MQFAKKVTQITSILLTVLLYTLTHDSLSALGISISPARYELTADKGKTVYGDITVANQSDVDQVYSTSVENFSAEGETGRPLFTKENKDIASWVLIDKQIKVAKGK